MTIRRNESFVAPRVPATGTSVARHVALRGLSGGLLLGPGGLNPSLIGQQAIARAGVERLAA